MKPNPGRIEDIFTQIIVIATEIYPPHMKERHLLPPFYLREALRALQTKIFHDKSRTSCPKAPVSGAWQIND